MSVAGRRVVITGGTGSVGRALVRRLRALPAGEAPAAIKVVSRDELKQQIMRLALAGRTVATDETIYGGPDSGNMGAGEAPTVSFQIGDVRRYEDAVAMVRDADVLVHAAALKQVPTCEYFPDQAQATNVGGAVNLARAIADHGSQVQVALAIGTDKACKPVNVMGMTKALQERVFIAANLTIPGTRFCAVRYGNVVGSRGSVVPLFEAQAAAGGPVTITDPRMTRFLVTLDQAVDTILAALAHAGRGEVFVPTAPGVRIADLAAAIAAPHGADVAITGIRPGEKLEEMLVSEEEAERTIKRDGHYVIRPMLPELAGPVSAGDRALDGAYCSSSALMERGEVPAFLASSHTDETREEARARAVS
jgi:FlaA1/EpsC-like NDP-sugar epimerase